KAITDVHSIERNVAVPEPEAGFSSASFHRVNASAFFFLVGISGIEHHAVPGFERRAKVDEHLSILDPIHLSQIDAALLAKTRMRQLLVVDPAKPAGIESARKSHFQIITAPLFHFGGGFLRLPRTAALQSRSSLRMA